MQFLFKLKLHHDYYDDGVLQGVTVDPDAQTADILKRCSLRLFRTAGGIELARLKEVDTGFFDYLIRALDNRPLTFHVRTDVNTLYAISDFPADWCGHVLYDSRYTADSHGIHSMTPTLLPATSDSSNAVTVQFHMQDLKRSERVVPIFSIRIDSRQTAWKYHIFNRSQQKIVDPIVTDGHGFEFFNLGKVPLDSGEGPLLFSSGDRTFTLRQTPEHTFRLIDRRKSRANRRSSEKLLVEKLPTPTTPGFGLWVSGEAPTIHSEMFVYI